MMSEKGKAANGRKSSIAQAASEIENQRRIDALNSARLADAKQLVVNQIKQLEWLLVKAALSDIQQQKLSSLRRVRVSINLELEAIRMRAVERRTHIRGKGRRQRIVQGPAQGVTSLVSGGSPGLRK